MLFQKQLTFYFQLRNIVLRKCGVSIIIIIVSELVSRGNGLIREVAQICYILQFFHFVSKNIKRKEQMMCTICLMYREPDYT